MSEPIVVVLAADANFSMQLTVAVASISRVAAGQPHTVFILHDGYSSELKAKVARAAGTDLELVWVDARTPVLDGARLPGRLPPAALYRLRIETLLPPSIDRVLYLDSDTLILHSLLPLWQVVLGDSSLVGAVHDSGMCWTAHLPWRQLGVAPGLPYFNSGVLVIPLDRWRAEGVSEQAFDLMTRFQFKDGDQGALNAVLAGKWLSVDPRWNVQTHHLWAGDDADFRAVEDADALDAALRDPAVVHLCLGMWKRPWQPESRHRYRDEWLELLDTTDWAGWRPTEPGALFKLRRRARRAAEELLRRPAVTIAP